jgi:hypothetical protein
VLDGDEIPWVKKKLVRNCGEWKITGEVFLTVIRGDDNRLCHGDDVLAKGSEEAR